MNTLTLSHITRLCLSELRHGVLQDALAPGWSGEDGQLTALVLAFEDGKLALIEPMERNVKIGIKTELFLPEIVCGRDLDSLYGLTREQPDWLSYPGAADAGALISASALRRENVYVELDSGREVVTLSYDHGVILRFSQAYLVIKLADSIPGTMSVQLSRRAPGLGQDVEEVLL